jgi:hypothetical protein
VSSADGSQEYLTKGDNNHVDDRGLYNRGQMWLKREHIVGRARGYIAQFDLILSFHFHNLMIDLTCQILAVRRHGDYFAQRLSVFEVCHDRGDGHFGVHDEGKLSLLCINKSLSFNLWFSDVVLLCCCIEV